MNAKVNVRWTGLLFERARRLPAAVMNAASALARRIAAMQPGVHSRMGSSEAKASPAARRVMLAMRQRTEEERQ